VLEKALKAVEEGYVFDNNGKWVSVEDAAAAEDALFGKIKDGYVQSDSRWVPLEIVIKKSGYVESPRSIPLSPPDDSAGQDADSNIADDDTREIDISKYQHAENETPPHLKTEIIDIEKLGKRTQRAVAEKNYVSSMAVPAINVSGNVNEDESDSKILTRRNIILIVFAAVSMAAAGIFLAGRLLF
jgi:hypothetical protein